MHLFVGLNCTTVCVCAHRTVLYCTVLYLIMAVVVTQYIESACVKGRGLGGGGGGAEWLDKEALLVNNIRRVQGRGVDWSSSKASY